MYQNLNFLPGNDSSKLPKYPINNPKPSKGIIPYVKQTTV